MRVPLSRGPSYIYSREKNKALITLAPGWTKPPGQTTPDLPTNCGPLGPYVGAPEPLGRRSSKVEALGHPVTVVPALEVSAIAGFLYWERITENKLPLAGISIAALEFHSGGAVFLPPFYAIIGMFDGDIVIIHFGNARFYDNS